MHLYDSLFYFTTTTKLNAFQQEAGLRFNSLANFSRCRKFASNTKRKQSRYLHVLARELVKRVCWVKLRLALLDMQPLREVVKLLTPSCDQQPAGRPSFLFSTPLGYLKTDEIEIAEFNSDKKSQISAN